MTPDGRQRLEAERTRLMDEAAQCRKAALRLEVDAAELYSKADALVAQAKRITLELTGD